MLLPHRPAPCWAPLGPWDPSGLCSASTVGVFVHGQKQRERVVPDVSALLMAETKAFLTSLQPTSAPVSCQDRHGYPSCEGGRTGPLPCLRGLWLHSAAGHRGRSDPSNNGGGRHLRKMGSGILEDPDGGEALIDRPAVGRQEEDLAVGIAETTLMCAGSCLGVDSNCREEACTQSRTGTPEITGCPLGVMRM